MKNTIHNFEKVYDQTIARIERSEEFSEKNKSLVRKFISQLQLEGVGKAKAIRYLGDMFTLNRLLKKDFDLATKDDLKRVIGEIQSYSHWKEETKNSFKIMVRKLFRAVYDIDEKGVYPEQVKFIKLVSRVSNKTMFEILTDEEIKSLIRVCTSLRDKAFMALLAESGCRISEIGTLQIKNVTFESGGARIIVHGKTGPRSILIIKSAPYLQIFINNHPSGDDPEAYLWHNGRGKRYFDYSTYTKPYPGYSSIV